MDEHTRLGTWWRPGNPRRRLFGVLRVKPGESLTLDAAGDLAGEDLSCTIVGRSQEGEAITLLRCITLNTRGWGALTKNRDQVSSQSFLVHEVLLGQRFKSAEAATFRFSEVEYPDLPSLAGGRVLRILQNTEDGLRSTHGVEASQEMDVQVGDTEVHLVVGTGESMGGGQATFRAQGRLSFFSRTPRTLDQWSHDFIQPIDYLLSLSLSKPCLISSQSVLRHAPWWKYVQRHKRVPEIKVIRGESLRGPDEKKSSSPLFSLSEDGVDFPTILSHWLEAWARLELPLNIYFATIYAPFMYAETRFLYLVQAIEGYHRVRHASFGRRNGGLSLRKRLEDVVDYCVARGLALSEPERAPFISAVIGARDDLSHGGLDPTRRHRWDYFPLHQRLALMMRILLVSELRVSDESQRRILERLLSGHEAVFRRFEL